MTKTYDLSLSTDGLVQYVTDSGAVELGTTGLSVDAAVLSSDAALIETGERGLFYASSSDLSVPYVDRTMAAAYRDYMGSTLTIPSVYSTEGMRSVALRDIDGDGEADLSYSVRTDWAALAPVSPIPVGVGWSIETVLLLLAALSALWCAFIRRFK